MTRHYVLLDRDGTINVDAHYLSRPEQVVLLPGAAEGLRRLQSLGSGLIVLANQSGVARGYFDMAHLDAVNARLHELLAQEGIRLDGLYACPHGPGDGCACRKPRPGLVERAVRDHGFDPEAAYMVGDKLADIALGQAVKAVTILVRTGYSAGVEREGAIMPDFVADSLADAAIVIEGHQGMEKESRGRGGGLASPHTPLDSFSIPCLKGFGSRKRFICGSSVALCADGGSCPCRRG